MDNRTYLDTNTVLNKKYRVLETLGRPGGFSLAYKVKNEKSNDLFAIKEYYPDKLNICRDKSGAIIPDSGDEAEFVDGRNSFMAEALRIKDFNHDCIVKVKDLFSENNTVYIVMDLVSGKSFIEIASKERYDWNYAVDLIEKACLSLGYIHSKKYFHQDVTPGNLMLAKNGRVILIDFGGVHFLEEKNSPESTLITPGFAAPEQWDKDEEGNPDFSRRGAWTDIYGLAAVLYYLLAHSNEALRGPGLGNVRQACWRQERRDPLPKIDTLVGGLPQWLTDAVHFGLTIEPEKRPQSVSEFLTALRRQQQGTQEILTQSSKEAPVVKTSNDKVARAFPWKILLLLGALAGAPFLVWILYEFFTP